MKKEFIFLLFIIFICFFVKEIFAINKIDINIASLSELDQLTGIGPAYAQKIVENRPYLSLNDLLRIKGIGPATLQKIKDQALACINCDIATPPLLVIPAEAGIQNDEKEPWIPNQVGNDNTVVPIIYPDGVVINEILPNPEGADEENEFIEIYNTNNFDVNLSGWKIKDTEGTTVTFTISENTNILANKYLVFKRPQTKISLNNSGDSLNLIFPNNKIADSVSFTKAPLNQSYNKINSNWSWSPTSTPAFKNIISKTSTNNSKDDLLKIENSGKNTVESDKLLSSIIDSKITNKKNNINNPWFLFIIVLIISIILSIIILVIKIKFKF